MLAAASGCAVRQREFLGESRTDKGGVIPCDFSNGTRKLLQPAVVRITTVVKIRVGTENELQLPGRNQLRDR